MYQVTTSSISVKLPDCPRCGTRLEFDPVWMSEPISCHYLKVALECPVCHLETAMEISVTTPTSLPFRRKKTCHEGIRADYEDALSFMRKFTTVNRRFPGPHVAMNHLDIDYKIARAAFRSLLWKDAPQPKRFVERWTNEPDELPF